MKATWIDYECPKCMEKYGNNGFVAADQWGLFCAMAGCHWKKPWTPKEQAIVDAHIGTTYAEDRYGAVEFP